jgi:hypothetical protein
LLIKNGADPNQPVHLNDGETVWGLFLISIHSMKEDVFENLRKASYRACLLLIKAGANPDYKFVHPHYKGSKRVLTVLLEIFGAERSVTLEQTMVMYKDVHRQQTIWGALKSYVFG